MHLTSEESNTSSYDMAVMMYLIQMKIFMVYMTHGVRPMFECDIEWRIITPLQVLQLGCMPYAMQMAI
jgi:hypothetical protein